MTARAIRVGFDMTPAISGQTGIARYVTQLAAELERQGAQVRRYAVGRGAFPVPGPVRRIPVPTRIAAPWWRKVAWPRIEWLSGGGDVVHATGLLIPRTARPLVVTVHDIAALRYPDLHPDRHVRQQRELLAALHGAAAVVSVSAATADDLSHLGIRPERIVVAPLGLTPLADGSDPTGGSEAGYLLTVGETAPRKGYPVLLRALSRLDSGQRLVMAGPPAGDDRRLRMLAQAGDLSKRVSFTGHVSDATLGALYRNALALCFPSIAEGFGLPILEAMSAGVPVISSDIPTSRELAGDAAIYVPPDDEDAWAEAIESITADASLRARLAGAGRARASEFTWERTAEATLGAYRMALEGAS